MRIITGRARGVRLLTLEGEATRPTSERAKEAVFSSLQFELQGADVLDLFAGSGQMGLEALSRGARHATFCDLSRDAISIVRKNAEKTRLIADCRTVCADFQSFLRDKTERETYGLVFLDPPYASKAIPQALALLLERKLLHAGARLVCEAASFEDVFGDRASTLADRFSIVKQAKYGLACVTVLSYHETEEQP